MEVIKADSLKDRVIELFLKEKKFFANRREMNWKLLTRCLAVALVIGVTAILLIPESKKQVSEFNSKDNEYAGSNYQEQSLSGNNPTLEAAQQIGGSGGYARQAHSSLGYLYASDSNGSSRNSDNEQSSSMIINRGGLDAKTQLPPGSRILIKLYEKATVADQGMPVIGVVTQDYVHEDTLAIPKESKVFGVASFDESSGRAKMDWQSIQFPDGRSRNISAIGVGQDGQVGVDGDVQSHAIKNSVGQTLTRFVGAYAEGSMQRGAMGGNPGGESNGWKNAISATAQDRAEAWAEDLKKEKKWIEISNQTEFFAVLTAAFAFRDPGASYGR